ncbi:MAG TPA: hypothetical protein VMA09_00795 [Candidatus Binataceae bacterium]|nr:hypothetical protein [Candidatus Binataceae bacterium]
MKKTQIEPVPESCLTWILRFKFLSGSICRRNYRGRTPYQQKAGDKIEGGKRCCWPPLVTVDVSDAEDITML